MESQLLFLSDLNFNLEVWKRELKFQESEMDYFEEKLEHIAIRDLGKEVMIRLLETTTFDLVSRNRRVVFNIYFRTNQSKFIANSISIGFRISL